MTTLSIPDTVLAVSLPMFVLLVKATILLLAALGVTVALRRASAGVRHLVWLGALGAVLVLPALGAWSPLRLAVFPASFATSTTLSQWLAGRDAAPAKSDVGRSPVAGQVVDAERRSGGATAVIAKSPDRSGQLVMQATDAQATLPAWTPRSLGLGGGLLVLWGGVALALAGWLAFGAASVSRIVRRSRSLDSSDWRAPLLEIADRLAIDEPPRLLRSEDVKMPFACGLLHPTIVLPAESDAWTLERRQAVLLHELGHVRRRDLVGHTLGRLACAIYWFHPLVWTAARRLRAESERACDDLAIICGARASDYAEHLLDIVTGVRRDSTPVVALAMARRKEFEGRMLAILDPELRRNAPTRRQSAVLVGALGLLAITISVTSPVARSAAAAVVPAATSAHVPLPDVPRASSVAPIEAPRPHTDAPRTRILTLERHDAAMHTRTETTNVVRTDTASSALAHRDSSPSPERLLDALITRVSRAALTSLADRVDGGAKPAAAGSAARQQQADDRSTILAHVLRTDTSASLRRVAAWGLAQHASSEVALDALVSALRQDGSASVREMAAWALADADDHNAKASSALIAALRGDAEPKVRTTAAWALGSAGDEDAVPALVEVLGAEDASLRGRAAWAIGSLSPRRAPRQLTALLTDRDTRVRRIASWALFSIRDPETVGAIDAAMSKEQDSDVRRGEIRALAAMGDRSIDAIKRLLDTRDPEIRSMAIKALAGSNAGGPWPWPWPEPRPFP